MADGPIGIFDSGVGGLTVVKEVLKALPNEDIIYIGDTARVPYGTKSEKTVSRYALQNTKFLIQKKIKFLVVACNTASSLSLPFLEERYDIPVLGVIGPGAKGAIEATRNRKIGVIGTESTIRSMAYDTMLKKRDNRVEVYSKPCPLFVPLVEEGWTDNDITRTIVERYLKELREKGIDTLILGCTHYPLLKKVIGKVMGTAVTLIDSAVETAKIVKEELVKNKTTGTKKKGSVQFLVTDLPEKFAVIGSSFLGNRLENVTHVDINLYEKGDYE
jgi:glutamate racemase